MSAPWVPGLATACLIAAAGFGSLVSTSGLIELIRRDLGLSFGQGGFLLSAPFALISLFALAGGRVVDRLGARRVLAAGALLALAGGGGRAFAGGFWGLALGTALVGVGLGLIYPVLPKIVSGTAPEEKRGLGATLYTVSVISGAALGVAATPLAGGWLPFAGGSAWRGGYLGWALLLLAAFLLWRRFGGAAPEEAEEAPASPAVLRDPAVWGVAASLFVNNVVFFTSLGWLPALLAGKGWSPAGAGWVVSLVPWLGIVAVLTTHPAAAALGGERNMIRACALSTALALAVLPGGGAWAAALGTAALGFTTNFWFLLCLAFPARRVERAQAGTAAGLIIGVGYAGGFVGPWAAGVARDLAGGFGPALYALALLSLASALAAPFFAPPGKPR
ncbi:MAG: hypothetical protein A3J27_11930 [Candidatus Tectomicrobia bacterium RIFCSPLOWO2_12_FULL_69_37]|nr:MAG: hypothetical protein A3J27_11930 [Candidatus Tectomicrobia bacterium RIFCSPLOWO2_12_FULL_69_37]OGL62205.1 MAG: hypothetical protein A3I72_01710 [Candidatus Tectomicrobia bacterium RIFCSPLOWO2_02_FULL_70_19]